MPNLPSTLPLGDPSGLSGLSLLRLALFVLLFFAAIVLTALVGPSYVEKLGWMGPEAFDGLRSVVVPYPRSVLVIVALAFSAMTLVFVSRRDWLTTNRELLWGTVCLLLLANPTHATPYLAVGFILCLFALALPVFWFVTEQRAGSQASESSTASSWESKAQVMLVVIFACYLSIGWTHSGMVQEARAAEALRGVLEELIDARNPHPVVLVDLPGLYFLQIDRFDDRLAFSMHDLSLRREDVARARSFTLAHGGSVFVNEITSTAGRTRDIEFFEVYAPKDVDAAYRLATDILHNVHRVQIKSTKVRFLPEGL